MQQIDFLGEITIGYITQAVSNFADPVFVHSDGTAFSNPLISGGVSFFQQTLNGKTTVMCANVDSDYAIVSAIVPNDTGTNTPGATYFLALDAPPVVFSEITSPVNTRVITGPLSGQGTRMILAFNGLKADGNSIKIGPIKLQAAGKQLSVSNAGTAIKAISYMYLASNRSVNFSSGIHIPPTTNADGTTIFAVNFEAMGFNLATDVFDGIITLQLGDNAENIIKPSNANTKFLTEAQKAYFKWLKEKNNK